MNTPSKKKTRLLEQEGLSLTPQMLAQLSQEAQELAFIPGKTYQELFKQGATQGAVHYKVTRPSQSGDEPEEGQAVQKELLGAFAGNFAEVTPEIMLQVWDAKKIEAARDLAGEFEGQADASKRRRTTCVKDPQAVPLNKALLHGRQNLARSNMHLEEMPTELKQKLTPQYLANIEANLKEMRTRRSPGSWRFDRASWAPQLPS
jgi:hypothetical protein